MTSDDRELLQILRRQQAELQRSLARLDGQLAELEARAETELWSVDEVPVAAFVPDMPPAPPMPPAAELPAIPAAVLPPPPPPVWAPRELPRIPPPPPPKPHALPSLPPAPRPSLEFRFGRWLTRLGAVFGIITLIFIFSYTHTYLFAVLGPRGILGLSAALCVGIVALADRMERRAGLLIFARSFMALGLAGLYVTFYAAHRFDSVRVIASPLVDGVLLLLWSVYVLSLANRKKSQTLALFSIALAYFSTAITPVGRFTMAADLLLAGTAVVFFLRNGWAALSYLSLAGTYLALLRRLVVDENGDFSLDISHGLPFAPYAVYLIGAWVIFTAAVLLSTSRSFRGGKRLAFLSLNNGALAGLLTLTTYIAGYGYGAMGWTLLWIGLAFLVVSRFPGLAGWRRTDDPAADVTGAYLAQGLAVFTAGLMGIYTGITRGVLLAVETLFLGRAAAYSRSAILRVSAYVVALFATLFLLWEILVYAHAPWRLGLGGAAVILANAWWARRDGRIILPRNRLVLSASYYCALALGLIYAAMSADLSDSQLPPALAVAAAVLTFSIYLFPLYELPPLAQTLLIVAQGLVLFPVQTGVELPPWSTAAVAALTLFMLAWWSRQRVTRQGPWIVALNFVYALALVGLAYHAVRPYVDLQTWMMSASLLAFAFLFFGALTRVWPLAVMGQLFLAVALYHFFIPVDAAHPFPWNGWAATVPLAFVFITGRVLHGWLRTFPETPEFVREPLVYAGYGLQVLALLMLVYGIFMRVPEPHWIATFLFLGSLLLAWNAIRSHPFGVRASFLPSLIGAWLVVGMASVHAHRLPTFLNGLAVFFFLVQPTVLRHARMRLVAEAESWVVILVSALAGWFFVGAWVATRFHPNYLTMGWALYALFLFLFGLLVRERRQRWCGLAILVAAMIRVLFYDIWGFSNGYKVLTFVVLTLITLGLGFVYARFADRLKTWL